jgi:drug/metabolite transporter (DMT)-like permease
MRPQGGSLLALHAAVLLFGLAGLFARWVPAHPVVIVFGRATVAALALLPLLVLPRRAGPIFPRPQGPEWLLLPACGAVLAFHWWAFFTAIRESTLAVALLTYATAPVFAALLEPLLFRERLSLRTLAAAALSLAGVAAIVPEWDPARAGFSGAAWGVLSGLSFAVLALLNRRLVRRFAPIALAWAQDAAAALLLAPWVPTLWRPLGARDLLLLALLGIVCTALAHGLFIRALRHVPAGVAAVVSALEPVYGVLLGVWLLGEVPSVKTLAGGALVLAAALSVALPAWGLPPGPPEGEVAKHAER